MNFDFLKKIPRLNRLARYCEDAEALVYTRTYLSAMSARQAMEYLIKLIFASKIENADNRSIYDMVNDQRFIDLIDDRYIMNCIHFIRKMGNAANHTGELTQREALDVVENLHFFVGEMMLRSVWQRIIRNLLRRRKNPSLRPHRKSL